MADYLPPVVVRVTSEFDPKGLAAAKTALDDFKKQQTTTFGAQGKAAGRAFGDNLPGGAQPGLDEFTRKTKASDDVLVRMMADFNRIGEGASKFGRTLTDDGNYAKFLEERLGLLGGEVRKLAEEFGRTGNVDIYRRLKDNQGAQDTLNRVKKTLEDVFGTKSGLKAGDAFEGGFLSALGDLALSASPVLIPMAGLLAAEVLAAVGGAITGGVGLGGIFAGAITQIKTNPRVQAAAKDFGHWFSAEWQADTASFARPTEDAIHLLKAELRSPMADLRQDFEVIAPYTRDFANSLGIAAQKFMPGLNALLQNSGPLIQELGHDVEMLATAGGDFLASVSRGGKGEAEALDTLVRALSGTIEFIGRLIEGSAKLYDMFVYVAKGAAYVIQNFTPLGIVLDHLAGIDLVGYVEGIGGSFDDSGPKVEAFQRSLVEVGLGATLTADDFSALSGQINQTIQTSDVLAGQMAQKMFNSLMSVDQATLGWHESLTNLDGILAKNGRQIDKHTDSINLNSKGGQENERAILGAVTANMASYQAFIAVGGSATDAAKQYDTNTAALERQLKKAGYTKAEIDGLIGKYRNIPKNVDTDIAMHGLTDAINDLDDAIRLANHLDGRIVKITVEEQHRTTFVGGNPATDWHGHRFGGIEPAYAARYGLLAPGGIATAGTRPIITFAEPGVGREGFVPEFGISDTRAYGLVSEIASWHGLTVSKGPSPAMLSALSGPTGGGFRGGAAGGTQMIELVVHNYNTTTLDGRVVHQQLIPHAQRYRVRTGTTGLETPP